MKWEKTPAPKNHNRKYRSIFDEKRSANIFWATKKINITKNKGEKLEAKK